MNTNILTSEVQEFIFNFSDDISQLAFSGSPFKNVTTQELLQQIESRRKAKTKLPTWYVTKKIIYPPKLNIEQTSSETTAHYKATLVKGRSLADLTGGFGIDSYHFSKTFTNVHHFELNEALSKIARYNFKILEKENINCYSGNGLELIKNKKYDCIYLDPSRRHDSKGKVFFLKDCEPNVPENLSYLLKRGKQLLVKTSPMLDLSVGLEELKLVKEIHIVAVNNEVKELLWLLTLEDESEVKIKTINFNKNTIETFDFNSNQSFRPTYSLPKKYLYEPNAAIMKSGSFELLAEAFRINKLHKHSHLYTNNSLIDFPGRKFIIRKVIPFQKKEIIKLKIVKANITTRNFPESVSQLRKKLKIKDGGDDYLFFTTSENNIKILIVCSKV